MNSSTSFGGLVLAVLALFALALLPASARASANEKGGASKVIEPGGSHSNGVATVANASNSRGNARMTPWDHGDNDTTNDITTGQQFAGQVDSTSTKNAVNLGSRSGTQSEPIRVNMCGGDITLGSDSWANVHNTGNGTITARDVSGNVLGVWGPGQQSTIHHP